MPRIYDVDGLAKEWNFTCGYTVEYPYSRINRRIPIYAGAGITSLLGLIAIIYTLYKVIKKTITKRQRKSVFKRINGGLLLKQQEEIDPSLVNKTILFTSHVIKTFEGYEVQTKLGEKCEVGYRSRNLKLGKFQVSSKTHNFIAIDLFVVKSRKRNHHRRLSFRRRFSNPEIPCKRR
ncbi:hypothetical protein R6Q57_026132 [Mikania cordata]